MLLYFKLRSVTLSKRIVTEVTGTKLIYLPKRGTYFILLVSLRPRCFVQLNYVSQWVIHAADQVSCFVLILALKIFILGRSARRGHFIRGL